MAYGSKILTSLFGRRIGLQRLSTGESGGSRREEFLVGPDDFRVGVTTAETTAVNVQAFGISVLPGTSAASSAVYTLEPPIPGVRKVIQGGLSNGPVYLKTANAETIISASLGSSFTTIKVTSLGGCFELVGVSTSQWLGFLSSGAFALTTTT